jgi:HK97 family phage prohead protease
MKPAAKELFNQPMRRVMTIGTISAESRTVELAFSSNAEIERWPGMIEVLDHSPEACDLSRLNDRANLLFNHDADEVLGVVETARIDADGMGRALVRFGKSECAEEAWRDVQDGILTKVSVGYRIREVKLTEEREALDVYTVTRWEPYEISIVTIPADTSGGVGRSLINPPEPIGNGTNQPNPMQDTPTPAPQAPAPAAPEINVIAERNAAVKGEQDRTRSILEAGDKYGMPALAAQIVRDGGSLVDFQAAALAEKDKRSAQIREGVAPIGLNEREAGSFSFLKLIRALAAEPKILLLDEPMAGMNVEEKQDMCRFILDVNEQFGTTIVLIEHDMGVVMDISDRVVVLDYGKKIGDGTPDEVRNNQDVINAYLGVAH